MDAYGEPQRIKKTVQKKYFIWASIISVIIHPQQHLRTIGVVINPLMKFWIDVFALSGFVIF
jgi:hypothetical protein